MPSLKRLLFPFVLYVYHFFLIRNSRCQGSSVIARSFIHYFVHPFLQRSPFQPILTSDLDSPRSAPTPSASFLEPFLTQRSYHLPHSTLTPTYPHLFLPRLRLTPLLLARHIGCRHGCAGEGGQRQDIFGVGGRLEPYHQAALVCFVYVDEAEGASLGSNSG